MDLVEAMWISRPQERPTKVSDLSDGSIACIKFYNANIKYTIESFKLALTEYQKSICCNQEVIEVFRSIDDCNYIIDYINSCHFSNELDIFTPDFEMKRTHHMTSYKSDEDVLRVRVISNEGVIKRYDMPAIGMTIQDLSNLIDKERNGYEMTNSNDKIK